ncbi:hypothetical protein M433DRAFT_175631 [Acidomyces richmondensis BFW]|nr:hypothetical protein M433DRAFT_175631 [Acidomyces richmondensis BFW]
MKKVVFDPPAPNTRPLAPSLMVIESTTVNAPRLRVTPLITSTPNWPDETVKIWPLSVTTVSHGDPAGKVVVCPLIKTDPPDPTLNVTPSIVAGEPPSDNAVPSTTIESASDPIVCTTMNVWPSVLRKAVLPSPAPAEAPAIGMVCPFITTASFAALRVTPPIVIADPPLDKVEPSMTMLPVDPAGSSIVSVRPFVTTEVCLGVLDPLSGAVTRVLALPAPTITPILPALTATPDIVVVGAPGVRVWPFTTVAPAPEDPMDCMIVKVLPLVVMI